jgi:hypothetical protein
MMDRASSRIAAQITDYISALKCGPDTREQVSLDDGQTRVILITYKVFLKL